jgi:aldehyde dehydrogenase (NAD(P)+)
VIVVPGPWSDRELAFQAESVAGMVVHNASFNCVAAKMLVLPRGWALRDRFLGLVRAALQRAPVRRAYYPGAAERYRQLTDGRSAVERIGAAEGALPWTLVTGLDPESSTELAFAMEPFCSILSETSLGNSDPVEFLDAAVRFSNERLRGTLAAAILVSGRSERDAAIALALDRGIRALRYGTVSVNVWPGMAFGFATLPWGAYPGAPLTDIQSGRGFVHNTRMLDRVEKAILRAPAWSPVKLPYFPGHRSARLLGRRLARLEETGGWMRVPPVLAAALRG